MNNGLVPNQIAAVVSQEWVGFARVVYEVPIDRWQAFERSVHRELVNGHLIPMHWYDGKDDSHKRCMVEYRIPEKGCRSDIHSV